MLDFHNHMMPGVDDGAANIDETRAGIEALIADGITGIITTPHITASIVDRGILDHYLEKIETGWTSLRELVAAEFPRLRIARGFEVMLDVPRPNLENPLLRLAGTKFVLIEFPFMNIPPNSVSALGELRDAGFIPILAHPERYVNMESNVELVQEWRSAGAYMQINAGSILGQYGARAKKLAWNILESGAADYMCSDYHGRGRCPVARSFDELRRTGMDAQAEALIMNAKRVIRGEVPSSLEPFSRKDQQGWKKMLPWV
jgi:protein-tyrosine phosphatase